MTFVYLICFLLITAGAIILLRLNPEKITDDLMRFVSPKQTLREKVLTAKGKKRSRKLTVELNRIRDALEQTGKGGQFSIVCAASVVLMILGCILAIMIDNAFLIPVFAIAFAMIPFAYAKRTVNYYDNHIKEELETSLSIITTSYVRTDDIVTAVRENMQHLKPPVKEIFAGFVAENMMISADIKQSIRHLKEKVSNSIFDEWCDTLIACQDDRTLKDTLMPIVSKLTDVRIVNNEIKGMLVAARTEYFMMAAMVVGNIPLLYFLNKDWYAALMDTTPGKIVLAICGLAIIVTAMLMFRFTRQVEYRK
ncbi:MAG: type II secretion system F family protein [Eubacteriales bacterium]